MLFGKKYFISRKHDNTDYISWHCNDYSKQLKLQMDNITVALHEGDGENALPTFLYKLEAFQSALQALLDHPIGQPANHRTWLNPEEGNVQHFTGHFAWGYSEDLFYYTLADCHRAIRGQYNCTTGYGKKCIKEQLVLLKRVSKHLASAIADFKRLEEKHVQ